MPVGWQKKIKSHDSEDGLGKAIKAPFLMEVLIPKGTLPRRPTLSNSCWNKVWTPAGEPWLTICKKFSVGSNISMSDWSCPSMNWIILTMFLLTIGSLSNFACSFGVLLS